MPDVVGINIKNYEPGQELVNGSDTRVVFPSYRKQTTGQQSANQGVAYKKVS